MGRIKHGGGNCGEPAGAHQAGRHMDQPHVGMLAYMRSDGRVGSAGRHAHPGAGFSVPSRFGYRENLPTIDG